MRTFFCSWGFSGHVIADYGAVYNVWHNHKYNNSALSAAAEAMRRILVDRARRKRAVKRGGVHQRVGLDNVVLADREVPLDDVIALDEALERLSAKDKLKADLVKLRYFAGLPSEHVAQLLGISHNTADKYWAYARAWLRVEIGGPNEPGYEQR